MGAAGRARARRARRDPRGPGRLDRRPLHRAPRGGADPRGAPRRRAGLRAPGVRQLPLLPGVEHRLRLRRPRGGAGPGRRERLRLWPADRGLLAELLRPEPRGHGAGARRSRHQGDALHDRMELHRRARDQGRYEKTIGRLFEAIRGPEKTAEDAFAQRDLQAYAVFLRQTPWYAYPFGARLRAFWRETPLSAARWRHWPRKLERRVEFTLEYGVKAIYAAVIGYASNTALGAADLEIRTVVVGPHAGGRRRGPAHQGSPRARDGRTLILTPRYQAYTELLVGLARRGRDVAEIAGNDRILVTVLAPERLAPLPRGRAPALRSARSSREPRRAPRRPRRPGRGAGGDDPRGRGRGRHRGARLRLLS